MEYVLNIDNVWGSFRPRNQLRSQFRSTFLYCCWFVSRWWLLVIWTLFFRERNHYRLGGQLSKKA